ncbi:MAG TPA: hypothetical protein PKZ07_00525 [Sedimentisphaerales bacterium]|nr:hypothetical protein [Sedimentisphaerales bacterium]
MATGQMPLKILVPAGLGGASLFLYVRYRQVGHLRIVDWFIAGSILAMSLMVVLASRMRTTQGWEDEEESPAFRNQRKLFLAVILFPLLLWVLYQTTDDFQRLVKPDEQTQESRVLVQALRHPLVIRTEAGEPDATGWVPALSPLGGFFVSLPNRFNEAVVALKMEGRFTPVVVVGAQMEDRKFVVLATRRSGGPKDLKTCAKAAVKSLCQFKNLVLSREDLFEGRFPWIEVEGDALGGKGLARIIATDRAVYGLAVEEPELTDNTRAAAQRVFGSFKIVAPEPNEGMIRRLLRGGDPDQ